MHPAQAALPAALLVALLLLQLQPAAAARLAPSASRRTLLQQGAVYGPVTLDSKTSGATDEFVKLTFTVGDYSGDGKADVKVDVELAPASLSSSGSEDIIGIAFDLAAARPPDLAVPASSIVRSNYNATHAVSNIVPTVALCSVSQPSCDANDDPNSTMELLNVNGGGGGDASLSNWKPRGVILVSGGGLGDGRVQKFSFMFTSASQALSISLVTGTRWYARLQSTDNETGSSKRWNPSINPKEVEEQGPVLDCTCTPTLDNLPAGGALGCNPAAVPSCATVSVTASGCDGANFTCSASDSPGAETCGATRTLTFTPFVDGCEPGAPQTVTYSWTADTSAPAINPDTLPDASLSCNAVPPVCGDYVGAGAANPVLGVDGCGGAVTVACLLGTDATSGCVTTRNLTFTPTDACGNMGEAVTVSFAWTDDFAAPTLDASALPAADLGCNAAEPTCAGFEGNVTASDGCGGSVDLVCTEGTVDSEGCGRSKTLTWTATDACGNADAVERTFTWTTDTTAPAIDTSALPATICCGATPGVPSFTDTCSAGGSATPSGSAVVSNVQNCARVVSQGFTATDGCGNSASAIYGYKVCLCGTTGFAGPPPGVLSMDSATLAAPYSSFDTTRWGWNVRLNSGDAPLTTAFWLGAGRNIRRAGVNAGAVTLARSNTATTATVTITFALHSGSRAPKSDLHIAARCGSPVTGTTAFGKAPFVAGAALDGAVADDNVYAISITCAPTSPVFVVVHDGAATACPPSP